MLLCKISKILMKTTHSDIFTQAGGNRCMGIGWSVTSVTLCVLSVTVCTLKETRLELSTPNLIHIYILYGRTSAFIDP